MESIHSLRKISLKKSGVVTLVLMAAAIIVLLAYFVFRDQSNLQKHKNTPAAQALIIEDDQSAFTDLSQNKISLNDDFGKVMVVMSWASWCPQCGADLESLGILAKEYQGKDVTVVAVNRGEDKYSAERFLATINVASELRIILDPTDHYFTHSEGYAMPETIIFRPDGSVAFHGRGEVKTEEIKQAIEEAQKE